ncbi:hypothetical protein C8J57DRAFT_1718067 [Mycena rebaudengoi]|nr:hypothetical protein C8J57DRAFT_1718067 [Mycena rebaudengoi]
MRVPQEIVDAIIDNFAMPEEKISQYYYWRNHSDADSLRACSLTSRSFLHRSRMHLFAAIFCHSPAEFSHFDHLLAESSHIGELYVRYFALEITGGMALAEDVVLPRILSRLPSLAHVTLDFPSIYGVWPSLFKASIRATLSLHSLRGLCLYSMHFANASEFELLLSHATSLKALTLVRIAFENPSIRRVDLPHEVRVVLESLELKLEIDVVDAMVSNFSTVDIRHLTSLIVTSTHIIPLLRVNAQTIQKVQSCFSLNLKAADPDILKGNRTLYLIEFGDLGHLKALRTVSLDFVDCDGTDYVDWPKLDAILAQAVDRLEDIHIHIATSRKHPPDIRSLLPSVRGKIAVLVRRLRIRAQAGSS